MKTDEIDPAIMEVALGWFVTLSSGMATAEDQAALVRWRGNHADHERAWQDLEDVGRIMRAGGQHVPAAATRATLLNAGNRLMNRRRALKMLALASVVIPAAWLERDRTLLGNALADYRTAVGERRMLTLDDGTRLWLNTATAVNVSFNDRERRVQLLGGEIQIATAADSARRPFIVTTADGMLRPIGTRFTVRRLDDEGDTRLDVSAGAVEARSRDTGMSVVVGAGRQFHFNASGPTYGPLSSNEAPSAWVDGMLSAERQRLADFVRELSRYRPGLLRCDPAIAELRLTGTYPLRDTDIILEKLAQTLPVRVIYRTPYWVTVVAR